MSNSEINNFCSDQGRTRVCGPRKAGQEGLELYAAAETLEERRTGQKGPFVDGHQLIDGSGSFSPKSLNIAEWMTFF